MIIIGIDPGVKGAMCVINTYKFRESKVYPFSRMTLSDAYMFLSEIRGGGVYRTARAHHVLSNNPSVATDILPEEADDNTMEIWLEEPGQIVINSLTRGKDATKALLAGMTSSRKLGRAIGKWEGIGAALNVTVKLVPPKNWQKALGLKTKGDKKELKYCAEKIFHHLTKENARSTMEAITLDTADSLLIGLYGYMQYTNVVYWPIALKTYMKSANVTY
jgi:hypothetical protein